MQEFFTWAMLGTYAGAVLATTLITQLLKESRWGCFWPPPPLTTPSRWLMGRCACLMR